MTIDTLMGLRIIVSINALRETKERLFPASRNRSRRKRSGIIGQGAPLVEVPT